MHGTLFLSDENVFERAELAEMNKDCLSVTLLLCVWERKPGEEQSTFYL